MHLSVDRDQTRAFKGSNQSVSLEVRAASKGATAQLDLVSTPKGLEATLAGEGVQRTLTLNSKYAGVYQGIKVRVGVSDPLGIFARRETHELVLAVEFLPLFLLAKRPPIPVSALMLGDYPAGRSGFGQEFHSAEASRSLTSVKDIMWKRQARLSEENLMVRVGEANIPEKLTVLFVENSDGDRRSDPGWMDLVSEAIARIGLAVVGSGTTFKLVHALGDKVTASEARDESGVADMVMSLWRGDLPMERVPGGLRQADIVVAAQSEAQVPQIHSLLLQKPSVVLTWGAGAAPAGTRVVFFSGREDVNGLVARVLGK